MPECSRGGEEHAHQAEERGRGRRGGGIRKDKKKAGEKRGQFKSQQKLLKSSAKQSKPAPNCENKATALHPTNDRRMGHQSQKQKPHSNTGTEILIGDEEADMLIQSTSSLSLLVCENTERRGEDSRKTQ